MRLELARLAVPRRSRRPERTVLKVSRTKICRSTASCCASAGRISAPVEFPDRESSPRARRVASFDAGASPATPRDPAPTSSPVSASTFLPRRSKSLRLSTGCAASSLLRSASRVSHTPRSDSALGDTSVDCPTWTAEKRFRPFKKASCRFATPRDGPNVPVDADGSEASSGEVSPRESVPRRRLRVPSPTRLSLRRCGECGLGGLAVA